MTEEDRVRLRHTDRWVGALVLLAVAIFLGAAIQRSVITQFFAGGEELTVLMPEEGGLAGLSEGSEAEVLGIRVGAVRRIIVAPEGRIRAELRIDDQAKVFIRTDSVATIRKRFGVAGPAYLDIARGEAAPLDWSGNPVIEAQVEEAATATAGALLEELRNRVVPVFDDLQRGTRAFSEVAARLERGEGTVGRLLSDRTIADQAEEAARRVNGMLETLDATAQQLRGMAAQLAGEGEAEGIPALVARANETMAALERASEAIAGATPGVTRIVRNVERASQPLPAAVVQLQQTARSVEQLASQLRGNWLLGGAGARGQAEQLRPPADRVRP
ncbi:MlaD family protein [Roseomonas sp. AR75]|uniref:MlaD family protein n=1 Tax=Roseomonas sp. AR75 TaxID=2562311 RepID=UPI0010C047B8|nr:MlaD family protein [Roseomonas sp. AR75]